MNTLLVSGPQQPRGPGMVRMAVGRVSPELRSGIIESKGTGSIMIAEKQDAWHVPDARDVVACWGAESQAQLQRQSSVATTSKTFDGPRRLCHLSIMLLMAALLSSCAGIERLTKLAEQGDTESAYDLAYAYYVGKRVERDWSSARLWFSRAARQGHACAATYVGRMYDRGGFGVEKDDAKALEWYTLGTEGGDRRAYLLLGFKHLDPEFGEPDYEKAAKRISDGLEERKGEGCPYSNVDKARALFNLGMMHYDGRGVKQDKSRSVSLLNQSRRQLRYTTHDTWTKGNKRVTQTTTHTPALDVGWIRSAATDHRFTLAYALMGAIYAKGSQGVEKDAYEAYVWYSMAVRSGNVEYFAERVRLLKQLTLEELQRARTEINSRLRRFER